MDGRMEVKVKERRSGRRQRGESGRAGCCTATPPPRPRREWQWLNSPTQARPHCSPDARPNHALVMHAESKSFVSAPPPEAHVMPCPRHSIMHSLLYFTHTMLHYTTLFPRRQPIRPNTELPTTPLTPTPPSSRSHSLFPYPPIASCARLFQKRPTPRFTMFLPSASTRRPRYQLPFGPLLQFHQCYFLHIIKAWSCSSFSHLHVPSASIDIISGRMHSSTTMPICRRLSRMVPMSRYMPSVSGVPSTYCVHTHVHTLSPTLFHP